MHGNSKRKVSGDELWNFLKSTGDGDEILRQTSLPLSQFAEAARHFFNDDCTERKRYLSIVFRCHRGLHTSKSRSTPVLNVNQFAEFLCSDGLPSDGLVFNSVEGGISSRACAWAGIADSSENRKRLLVYFRKYKEAIAVAVKDIQSSTPDDRASDLSDQNESAIPEHYPVLPSFEDGETLVTTQSGEDLTKEAIAVAVKDIQSSTPDDRASDLSDQNESAIPEHYPVLPSFKDDETLVTTQSGEDLTVADIKSVICDGTRTALELWLPSAVMDVCGYDRVRKSTLPALILPSAHSTVVLNAGVEEASQITEEILSDKRFVFLPYNQGGNHWCVIFADFCEKTFSFIDPYGARFLVVRRMFKQFLKLLKTRNEYTDDVIAAVNDGDWTIKYLDHAKQTDNYNCGVLVLNFIENLLSGKYLTEVTDPHDYRKVLVADILRIRESTNFTETSEDLPTENVGTVDGPMIDDSSGSEVNISSHRPTVRRLSSSSESSWDGTPFYKKPSLDTSDDSAEDALPGCENLSSESSKNCNSLSKKPSSGSSDTDELVEDAPTDTKKPSSESSKADGSLVIEGVRATSSSSTLSVDNSAPMKPPFLATGATAETQDCNIDSYDSDFSDNDSSDSNEEAVFPRKLKIQKRKSRKEARSTSSLRREPFRTTITQLHVPVDVWQSSCQGGKIDRPNFGYTIKERISGAVAPCPVNLSDSGRLNKSRTVVTGYAYCEHRGCRQFKFTITNLASNPILTVFARGTLDHDGGPRTTQLRGVKRQRVKAVLKTTKASKYMEGCIEEADEALIEAGNLQDIRPLPTIDKARSEVLAEEDLHADDTMDIICEMRKQECLARRCTQFIQRIADPLLVYLYSQEQLEYVQRGVFDLFFDATGSVVKKPRKNLKRVMYYAGVINIDGEMLPILELISCDHDAATITSFLLQFKHFVLSSDKPWPLFRRVVTDFSLALINSFMLAWNGCSLEYYLIVMYKAIYGQAELAEFQKMTFLRLCRNHFMKNSASDVNKHMGYPATKVAKEGIALLVAARDLQTFESIFNSLMTVMLSRTRSPEMMRHYESLEKLADGFAQCLPMGPEDAETSEEHVVPTVPTAGENFGLGLFNELFPFWTHFCAKYEAVVSACIENDDHQYPLNEFYQPDFVKNILVDKLAPLAPLWSDAMTSNGIPDATASNAPVEKWFDIVKNGVLREDTNLKVGRFVRRLSKKIAVAMKTVRLGLTEYLRPKGRVRRQTQKTTTEEVENQGLLEEEQWAKRRKVATHFQGNYLRSRVFSNPPPGSCDPQAMDNISPSHEESITENVLDVKGQGFDFGQHSDDELMFIYGESSHPVKWGDFYSLFGENYLSSKIIDALLSFFAETLPASSLTVIRCDMTMLALDHSFDSGFPLNNVRLLDKTQVAMPYCEQEHWVLGLFNFVEKEYTVLDPGSNEPVRRNNHLLTRFRSFLTRRNLFSSEHVDVHGWTIVNFDHALQEDEFNCGILVFHYISCLQKNIHVSTVCDPLQLRSQLIESCSKIYEAYTEMNVSTVEDGRPKILPNGLFEDISFYTQTGFERNTVVGMYNGGKIIVSRDTLLNLCGTSEIANPTIDSVVRALYWKEIAENADKHVVFSCDESYKCLFGTFGPTSSICSVDLRNKTGLMPYCIDGNWRLLVFDVPSRTIINLNPARGLHSIESKRRQVQFVDFLRKYNKLCKQYKIKISGWTTTKPHDYPRQKDSRSSGVYVILYIMCGLLSIPISDTQFKNFDADEFRKELGIELLRKSEQMRHRCLICGKGEDAREKNSKSLVRSKMVACDSCNRWVHTKSCARNITCSEEELDDPSTNYYCEFCTGFSDGK